MLSTPECDETGNIFRLMTTFDDEFDAAVAAKSITAITLLKEYVVCNLMIENRFGNAVSLVEAALSRLLSTFEIGSESIQLLCEDFVLWCNTSAMQALSQGQSDIALDLLSLGDQHTTPGTCHLVDESRRKRLRSITLNNFACYFKKHGKLHTAIQYLEKTLKLETSLSHAENPAGTHLNICVILSQMGRHPRAAEHARCAIELLKFERLQAAQEGHSNNEKCENSVLAIAYYNWGVELEHMRRYDQAMHAFTKGHEAACNELEPNNPMIQAIYKALIEVEDRIAIKKGYIPSPLMSVMTTPRTSR